MISPLESTLLMRRDMAVRRDNVLKVCASMRPPASKVVATKGPEGIERAAAFYCGYAFARHRHDTYGVGVTTIGAQCFSYRGASHRCLPGQVFILHPDEPHDGYGGDEQGFGYRIAYIDPSLVGDAVGTSGLPFLADPVTDDPSLNGAIVRMVSAADISTNDLDFVSSFSEFARALARAAGAHKKRCPVDRRAVELARAFLMDARLDRISVAELERVSGLSRWQLARNFRAAYGVSPSRFHLLRRLDAARALIRSGQSLAEAANTAGFADQPHFSRHFRDAFGFTPGNWRRFCT